MFLFAYCLFEKHMHVAFGNPYDGAAIMRSGIKADTDSLPAKCSVRRVSGANGLLFKPRAPHGVSLSHLAK
jgi:hypothetical protein